MESGIAKLFLPTRRKGLCKEIRYDGDLETRGGRKRRLSPRNSTCHRPQLGGNILFIPAGEGCYRIERKHLRILLLHDPGPAFAGTITLEFPLHAKGFDGFLDVGFADAETRGAFPHRGGALLEKKEEHLVLDFAPRRPLCGEIALHLDRLGDERERNRDDDRAGRKIEGFLAIAFDDEGDAMAALLGKRRKREDFEQGTVDRPAFPGVEILFRHVEREGSIGQNLDAVIEKEDRFGYFLYTFLDTARFDRAVDLGRIASPSFLLEKPREERGCKSPIGQGYRRCLGIPNPGSICFHRPEEGEEGFVFIGLVVSSEP